MPKTSAAPFANCGSASPCTAGHSGNPRWSLLQGDGFEWASWLEDEILLEELTSQMDPKTRRMFVLRVLGYSWAEIGGKFGVTAHNAEVQFAYGLKKARKRLFGKEPAQSPRGGSGKEG